MGILNITPDSFYQGSQCHTEQSIRSRVTQMIAEGVDIIDVGAYSTRPGNDEVSAVEEISRLRDGLSVIRSIAPDIPISVDTFRAGVARRAVEEMSANMINDISGGNMDAGMFDTVSQLKVPYILTHSRGTISTMHDTVEYDYLMADIIKDLANKVTQLQLKGVNDIIIDPGFGFSKSVEQNYKLLANLETLDVFKLPILVGMSRKSMITKLLGIGTSEALNGTSVVNTIALQHGAAILRVHDVKAAREVIKINTYLYHA